MAQTYIQEEEETLRIKEPIPSENIVPKENIVEVDNNKSRICSIIWFGRFYRSP